MPQTPHIEKHFTGKDRVRDIVIGMSDGLTVPFALAAGLTGAVAQTDTELFALEGEDFVAAVTGYAPSHEAVEMVVRSYGLGLGF